MASIPSPLPSSTRVLIIGGGVVGCSVAYHLGLLGWGSSALLLEAGSLGCGTTWHAAGLVGQLRATSTETQLSGVYGAQLYAQLEADTGVATGFRQTGSLTIARTPARVDLLRRQASRAAAFGITAQLITTAQAAERWPYMRTDDLLAALWLPGDGSITSTDLTASLAAGARKRGVTIREGVRVLGMQLENGRVRTVRTDHGDVQVEVTINCAGQWAREVGAMAHSSIPLHSAEHFYVTTDAFTPPTPTSLPVLRDPDACIYFREWSGGLVMGGFEPHAKPCFHHAIPHPFFSLLPDDWEHFEPLMEGALHRVPGLSTVGVRMVNGPESFTPDNRYLLGEVPGVRRMYVAAGMNSSGIASAGGAGKALAEWVVEDRPTMDLWAVDIRRFGPFHANLPFLRDRTAETLGQHYAIPYPHHQLTSARPMRRSPLHHLLAQHGAQWGSTFGWERALYFSSTPPPSRPLPLTFGKPAWFHQVGEEHLALRRGVGLADLSHSAKLLVQGRDASAFFARLCSSDIPPVDGHVRALLLNAQGGIEADVQLVRVAVSSFLVLSAAGQAVRDADWLRRHVASGEEVAVVDVTSGYGMMALVGPKAEELVKRCTWEGEWEGRRGDAWGEGGAREVAIGYSQVRMWRAVDTGAEGWTLLMPTEFAMSVLEELLRVAAAGEGGREGGMGGGEGELPVRFVGQLALDSVRVESGLGVWGVDFGAFTGPLEAGLEGLLTADRGREYVGKGVVDGGRGEEGRRRVLVRVVVDEGDGEGVMWGGESVWREEELVGYVGSAAWGHQLGKAVGLAWVSRGKQGQEEEVDREWVEDRGVQWHVDITGRRYSASVHLPTSTPRRCSPQRGDAHAG